MGEREGERERGNGERQPAGLALQLTDGGARHVFLKWRLQRVEHRGTSHATSYINCPLPHPKHPPPGRHTSSYVVDGACCVIDPLAPRTNDGELGPSNVITIAGDS